MYHQIRRAQAEDLTEIQAIARHTIDKNYRPFLGDEGVNWFIEGPSDKYLSEALADLQVMLVSEKIIAFAVCKDDTLELLMVNHENHRQGFGGALLEYCEQQMFADHAELKLDTFEGNGKALSFYLNHGWQIASRSFDEEAGNERLHLTKQRSSD